jgi:hypothetical protein
VTEQKSPTGIDIRRDAIEIDVVIVAEGLGIVASHVPVVMRNGAITASKPFERSGNRRRSGCTCARDVR